MVDRENYRIVKVIETVVTTYSVTCSAELDNGQVSELVEAKHTGGKTEDPALMEQPLYAVVIAMVSDIKSKIDYQLISDRSGGTVKPGRQRGSH